MTAKPTKAVIYARVSSAQQKTDGHGLESQEIRCREYAGYKDLKVVDVFRDDMSGSVSSRPGMMAMLAFLKKHRATPHVVIIDDISRLARGLEAHLQLRTAISNAGGVLQSPSIEFGEDADSLLVENLLASVSQHHRQKNADTTKNRMRARSSAGYWCFPPPVGYRFEKVEGHGKLMVRDGAVADVIAEGLEGYASGRFQTQAEVVRFWASRPEYPADLRRRLTRERANEVLTRVTYAGLISIPDWDLHLVPAKHEPLITYETYRKIQDRIAGRANVPARKDLNQDFPLRGFVTCGGCGRPLMGCWSTARNGMRHPYYLCQNKGGCPDYGKSIRRDVVEGAFETLLHTLRPSANLFNLAAALFRDLWQARVRTAATQAKAAEAELVRIDRSISQLLDRAMDADTPTLVKAYEGRIQALEAEKATLREKAETSGKPLAGFDATYRTALEFLSNPWKLWSSERLEDKRAVLKLAFADRLAFARNEGFRTAVTSSPFTLLSRMERGEYEMVPPRGLEPPTCGLGNRRSIRLSYGGMRKSRAPKRRGRAVVNRGRGAGRRPRRTTSCRLQVRRNILVHLEHRCLVLAEDLLQLVVGEDLALVLGVLELVRLDIVPDLADHLTAWQRGGADDGAEIGRRESRARGCRCRASCPWRRGS